jgi:hypothetical protein
MITKLKKVYYCEFCKKKKGMSASMMAQHEKHCTANPDRECRMCGIGRNYRNLLEGLLSVDPKELPSKYDFLDELLECPACVLTVIRLYWQKQGTSPDVYISHYPYKDKVAEFWAVKNEDKNPGWQGE